MDTSIHSFIHSYNSFFARYAIMHRGQNLGVMIISALIEQYNIFCKVYYSSREVFNLLKFCTDDDDSH